MTVNDSDPFVTVLAIQQMPRILACCESGSEEKIATASYREAAFDAVISQFEERVISLGRVAA